MSQKRSVHALHPGAGCLTSHRQSRLPLMGAGDWNDGMDRIGIEGRGESVWLGWFIIHCLRAFIPFCEERGDTDRAAEYGIRSQRSMKRLQAQAWGGSWYLRAYDDAGEPVGCARRRQCRIDVLPQAWAVLSRSEDRKGAARPWRR